MKFRVSDGYSAAIEFEANSKSEFIDAGARAIREFWVKRIPTYQTRKMEDAIKYNRLQLHVKTAIDTSSRDWTWVARSGAFSTVTIADLFRHGGAFWSMAEYTQHHAVKLAQFLGEIPAWLEPQLAQKSAKPILTLIK